MDDPSSYNISEPDIFSRGSLNLTYELIHGKDAELGLTVRNIVHGEALPKRPQDQDNKDSDYFRVGLDSFQVRAVVECLMKQEQEDPARAMMAKALIEDWMQLAYKMVAELPDDQKPPMG